MAQHLYAQQAGPAGGAGPGAQTAGDGKTKEQGKEDVIDAEFEVKK
jgi:hypothetical protein